MNGLLVSGAAPDARRDGEATALLLAATRNYPAIAAQLLKYNASIDAHDRDGVTALQVACFAGLLEVVRLLLWHGADVLRADTKGVRCRQLVDSHHAGSPLQLLIDHAEREAAGTPEADVFVSQARAQAAAVAGAAAAAPTAGASSLGK